MTSFANLPTHVALPAELSVANIDPIVPIETKSNSIKVYAINSPSVVTSFASGTTASTTLSDIPQNSAEILFDLPCSQGRGVWLDTRLSTVSFRATYSVGTVGSTPINIGSSNLRSSAYAFFDQLRVISQSGAILENIPEYGLTCDTILANQMTYADKQGLQTSYGFSATNVGHSITNYSGAPTANTNSSYSYSVPLVSGVVGVLNDRYFPIGLVKKLMVSLTTASVLPLTMVLNSTGTGASNFSVTISDFCLNLETINIGDAAANQIFSTLHDGKMYLHGQSWKTTSALIPNGTTGTLNLPVGISGSSVRSLVARFWDQGAAGTDNSTHGKYDSKNPMLNQYGWNISGMQVPASLYNPLLYPSQCFRSLQMAFGNFNSTQFKTGIPSTYYCKLVKATNATTGNGTTQDSNYSINSSASWQCNFFLAENLESIPKRGMLSGKDLTFQKVNLTLNCALAPPNPVNVFIHALLDIITIVNISDGETVTIM